MNVLVINGPNLNLLGVREPDLYGKQDYAALVALVEETCAQEGLGVEVYQSNHEGDIVDKIQAALGKFDGIVINPAAYTHTSVAILDALKAVACRRWRCISPTCPSGRSSGRCPTPVWPASRPIWVWGWRGIGRPSCI